MSELKICPFCGIPLKLVGSKRRGNQHYLHEYNNNCILNGFGFIATDENIQHWNTRKPMQNIVERLEEEYHEIDKSKKESYENGDWERFDMFTNLNRGIYKAIAIVNTIVKEEGEING